MRTEIYQDVTNQIIEALENGVRPWNDPLMGTLDNRPKRATGALYRGINVLILSMSAIAAKFDNPHWFTYKQAKSLGANVIKKQKGTKICFYKPWKTKDKETGEETIIPVLRTYTVFNACQIENLPDDFSVKLDKLSDIEKCDDLEMFFNHVGAKYSHADVTPHYSPVGDSISIPEINRFKTTDQYYATLGHEFIHWTAHKSRLNRDLTGQMKGTAKQKASYAFEELIAEIGASFLMPCLGIEPMVDDFHAPYLAGYLSILQNDNKAIFKAAAEAQKAVDLLFELSEKAIKDKAA